MYNTMIVDDSRTIRVILKKIIETLGYKVCAEAADGLEALALYKQVKPDIVFLDIAMPKLSGVEALKRIRQFDKASYIVMVTSKGEEAVVKECIEEGAKGYILKPFTLDKLSDTISKIMKKKI